MMKIFFIPLLFIAAFSFAQPYKNLVLEGGGVRGLAYAGAFTGLEKRGILDQIENVGGTSAGSIAGLMISLGYSAAEIDSIMRHLPLQSFNDGKGGILGKMKRFKKNYGVYQGERFEKWFSDLIAYKTGNDSTTFEELHQLHLQNHRYKDFYCTGSNITRQQVEIFSYQHTPHVQLKTAVHISSCIPLYFKPVILDSTGREVNAPKKGIIYQYYVDGGLIANYPITLFDSCENGPNPMYCDKLKYNPQTLGLKLERPEQIEQFKHSNNIAPYIIHSRKDYMSAFFNLLLETLERKTFSMAEEKGRTIYISQGTIGATIRKMKKEEEQELFENGEKAVDAFFDKVK